MPVDEQTCSAAELREERYPEDRYTPGWNTPKDDPLTVEQIFYDKESKFIRKPFFGNVAPGDFVAVRSCRKEHEDRTFLGIYVGDVSDSYIGHDNTANSIIVKSSMPNPCMWVPEIEDYIFGYESWWHKISTEDDLKDITNADIENVWYVRALSQLDKSSE